MRALRTVLASLLLTLPVSAQVIRFPGTTAVNAGTGPQPITLQLAHGGAVGSIHVTTQGSEGFDYAASPGGTCAAGATFLPGQSCTVNVVLKPSAPGERRGAVVLLDPSGAPLAQQFLTASATGPVLTFVPGTINTVAGDQFWIYSGDNTLATQTAIFLPFGLAVNAAGDLYIADSSNARIRMVSGVTGMMTTIAGNGIVGATGDSGPATAATLSSPSSIALDPAGNLYFADSGNNLVRRIDAFTGVITTVAGTVNHHGYTGDLGPATSATLNSPNGIALDAAGDLYIADTANHAIRVVSATTGIIRTIAGTGTAGFSGDAGPALAAMLSSPWSVSVAPTGELYIADQNNNRIRKIDTTGVISTIAGTGTAGFTGDTGPALQAQLNVPASVALDVAGDLYIADSGNNRIRKIAANTGLITTIAGNSGESFSGDNGPANAAGLYGPYTLALDGQNSLFIADVFHNRIRKIGGATAVLDFPAIRVGRVSAPLTQTVENDGNAPLDLTSILAIANAQVDGPMTLCTPQTPLKPLDQCVVGADFAPTVTGNPVLGQINLVSNAGNSPGVLTLSGQVLDIDPTTLALTSSINPSATGSPVTFAVTATSAGSTPTGAVTFLDSSTPLGTTQLAGGNASFTTSALTSGQHSITASYAGDSSNAAQVSTALLQVVKDAQAATSTTLSTSAAVVDAGAPLTLTAAVSTVTSGSAFGAVNGSVTFFDGTTQLGSAQINAGTAMLDKGSATFSTTRLAVGQHSLTAVYNGGLSDAGSTSAPQLVTVQLATTRLTLSSNANPAPAGAPLTLTAAILSTGGTPTGPITFFDGTTSLGAATLNGQGLASLQVAGAIWTPGLHTLTANYAGDAADGPSTAPALTEAVNVATASATVKSSLNPAGLGASVTFTATVTSNGGQPTGSVTFLDGTALLGTGTLNASGSASFATSALTLGSHGLTVLYTGDTYDAPATSPVLTQTVQQATIAATLVSSANPSLAGASVTFTARITGSGSVPTGTVALLDGTAQIASQPVDPSGIVTFNVATLTIGQHTLSAAYSGDANHAPVASATVVQNVLQATTTTLSASATQIIAGLPVTLHLAVTGASGQPITGTIGLTDGVTKLATLTPDPTGQTSYTTTLTPGMHAVAAAYSGDATDAPSAAAGLSLQVNVATTSATLASSANPADFGTSVTFTSTGIGNGATPTGSVSFRDGAATLSTVPLAANGTATLTLATLAPGVHPITAVYSGDSNDQGAVSATLNQQIARVTSLGIASSANPSLLNDAVTITVTAANGSATAPTGSVTLTDNGAQIGSAMLVNGAANFQMQAPALGKHALSAAYAGDSENHPANSQPLLQVVELRPTATTLTASTTALYAGQQLILISTLAPATPSSMVPAGTIAFVSGSTVLGTVPVNAAGIATLTVTPPAAQYSVTAQYSGDALFAASTSPVVAITVGPPVEFTLTATPPTLTLASGAHGTIALSIAANPSFTDTLAFGCAGLPASATCTFTTDNVAVAGGFAHSLSVTVDTGTPLGAGPSALLAGRSGPLLCGLPGAALLALLLRRRRHLASVLVLALGLMLTTFTVTGCGASFSQNPTPAGSYSFQVVATGVQTHATQTATVQLTVTK